MRPLFRAFATSSGKKDRSFLSIAQWVVLQNSLPRGKWPSPSTFIQRHHLAALGAFALFSSHCEWKTWNIPQQHLLWRRARFLRTGTISHLVSNEKWEIVYFRVTFRRYSKSFSVYTPRDSLYSRHVLHISHIHLQLVHRHNAKQSIPEQQAGTSGRSFPRSR
jgi:hypothetical protein